MLLSAMTIEEDAIMMERQEMVLESPQKSRGKLFKSGQMRKVRVKLILRKPLLVNSFSSTIW